MDPQGGPPKTEVQSLLRTVQIPSIQKTVLQTICSVNGLTKTGNKADLQKRLMQYINDTAAAGDSQRFYEIQKSIHNTAGIALPQPAAQPPPPPTTYYPPASPRAPSHYAMPSYNPPGSYLPTNGQRQASTSSSTSYAQSFTFKPSPFHEIVTRLGELKTLMPQHRNTVNMHLKAQDNQWLQHCVTDPKYRVMVFCAGGNTGAQDILFPHQSELKVNGGDVKANLRGLKNKPGSTRPVDITTSLRLKPPSYVNTIEFTYALTQKIFYFGVYVCKITPVEDLVARIQKKIRKDTTIAEIAKKASDPDVVATSQNISLKCPLSYMRLQTPCRGFGCSHVQCFDATSYLQLQEQGPQWVCPICNKSAPYEQLAIDEYVMEMVKGTADSVEQVTIEPDGKWVLPGAPQRSTKSQSHETSLLDDEDFYITDMFQTPTRAATTYLDTPPAANSGSRGGSTVPKTGTKRTAEVIDLTLSDSDDEPARPVKRANYGSNGYGNY